MPQVGWRTVWDGIIAATNNTARNDSEAKSKPGAGEEEVERLVSAPVQTQPGPAKASKPIALSLDTRALGFVSDVCVLPLYRLFPYPHGSIPLTSFNIDTPVPPSPENFLSRSRAQCASDGTDINDPSGLIQPKCTHKTVTVKSSGDGRQCNDHYGAGTRPRYAIRLLGPGTVREQVGSGRRTGESPTGLRVAYHNVVCV